MALNEPMVIVRSNKPLFALPKSHPAPRFLEALVDCHRACLGRHRDGIDQAWVSASDGRTRTFSDFMYGEIAFHVVLDGWLSGAPETTESERSMLESLPGMKSRASECKAAAMADGNQPVVAMCDQVLEMLDLWTECIQYRRQNFEN